MSTLKQLMKDGDELFGSVVILGEPDWQGVKVPDDTLPGEGETPDMEGDEDIDLEEEEPRPDEAMAANAQAALYAMRGKGLVTRALSAVAMHRARQIADRGGYHLPRLTK